MKDKLEREFDAYVTGVTSFGVFVMLKDFFVEGLVPMTALGNDFFVYEEKQHRLRGRTSGTTYRLGDSIRVKLVAIDEVRRRLDFRLAGTKTAPAPAPRSRRQARRAGPSVRAGHGPTEEIAMKKISSRPALAARRRRSPRLQGARAGPDPNVRMAISHDAPSDDAAKPRSGERRPGARSHAARGAARGGAGVLAGSSSRWKDKASGKEGVDRGPARGRPPLPDPSLVVRADVFLPAFTMGGGAITSDGVEPQNPAARITVFEKGKEIFAGWIFTRFPDVHPFTHPRFELQLEGGVPKAKT